MVGLNAVFSERRDSALAKLVIGYCGYKFGFVTVVSARNCYVSFTAAVVDIELVGLNELFVVGAQSLIHI